MVTIQKDANEDWTEVEAGASETRVPKLELGNQHNNSRGGRAAKTFHSQAGAWERDLIIEMIRQAHHRLPRRSAKPSL